MSGKNANTIGKIGEKATLKAVAEVFTDFGINVDLQTKAINLEEYLTLKSGILSSESSDNRHSELVACTLGDQLGKELATAIINYCKRSNIDYQGLTCFFQDTSTNTADNTKTEDLRVILKRSSKVVFDEVFSQKTKTKSINRMDGNACSTNRIFLEKLFQNTPLLNIYPQIMEIGNNDEWKSNREDSTKKGRLNELNSLLEKAKKENPPIIVDGKPKKTIPSALLPQGTGTMSSTWDAASLLLNRELGDNINWKSISGQRLKNAFLFASSTPEYLDNLNTVVYNAKALCNIKQGVHLAIIGKNDPFSPKTVSYISLNCPKYTKLVINPVKSFKIENNKKDGIQFNLDGWTVGIDLQPSAMKATPDLLKRLQIR